MSLNYVHPINATGLILDEENCKAFDITHHLNAHIYGDIYVSKQFNKKRAVTYSFIVEELYFGASQALEIPLINRKKYNINNITVSYVIGPMIPELSFEDVVNATKIYEGQTSENYIKVDIASLISGLNIETDFMITFIVQSDADIRQRIGAYVLEENLENVSVKVYSSDSSSTTYSLRRTVEDETAELTDAERFVDKYYTSWEEDILNSDITVRDYDKYQVSTNYELGLIDNKVTNEQTTLDIYLDETLETKEVVYNDYGSIVDDTKKQLATGYFYTTIVNGRAWVVDPDGYLNVIKNVMFPLPRLNTPDANRISSDTIEAYNNDEWKNKTELNMKALAFNTYEQYYNLINNNEFTYNMNVISKFPLLHSWAQVRGLNGEEAFALRNIFDDHFKFKLKWKIEKVIFENDAHKDSHIVAYMLDNEPRFSRDDLITCIVTTDSNMLYRKEAALRWLFKRFNLDNISISDITDQMCDEFISFEFYIYSKIITELIRAVDNNHMIFSPALQWYKFSTARGFLSNNDNFFKVLNKFYDAVVLTHYSTYDMLNEGIDGLKLNIPVFLNEFSMKSFSEEEFINKLAGPIVNTQEDRGRYYEHIALQCINNNNCIGYSWYQYSDIATEEGTINRGIVDNNNDIYEGLGTHMRKINTNAEGLRV